MRGIVPRGCAVVANGTASRLRVSITMHPTALYKVIYLNPS
jgi:hypothetical protein